MSIIMNYFFKNKYKLINITLSLVFIFITIYSFSLLLMSTNSINKSMTKKYDDKNIYELTNYENDINDLKECFSYKISKNYFKRNGQIKIEDYAGTSINCDYKQLFNFVSFSDNVIPDYLLSKMDANFSSRKINENEIIISKSFAKSITDDPNKIIGDKISITIDNGIINGESNNSEYQVLVEYKIIGIYSYNSNIQLNELNNHNSFIVNSQYKCFQDISDSKTILVFGSFNVENTVNYLDKKYDGKYYAKDIYYQISMIENENMFILRIFCVIGLLLSFAVLFNLIIATNSFYKKSIYFLSLANVLGISRRSIFKTFIMFPIIISLLVSFVSIILANSFVDLIVRDVLCTNYANISLISYLSLFFSITFLLITILIIIMLISNKKNRKNDTIELLRYNWR